MEHLIKSINYKYFFLFLSTIRLMQWTYCFGIWKLLLLFLHLMHNFHSECIIIVQRKIIWASINGYLIRVFLEWETPYGEKIHFEKIDSSILRSPPRHLEQMLVKRFAEYACFFLSHRKWLMFLKFFALSPSIMLHHWNYIDLITLYLTV